jgi:hypothetical protein
MKEDFITYIWKNKLLYHEQLFTTCGEAVKIFHPGQENLDAGPDFFNARIQIGDTLWAGNVEIHTRSSFWKQHGHHTDKAYDNIILHVVFENDQEAINTRGEIVPVLEIKEKFNPKFLHNYKRLKESKAWVPCQNMIAGVNEIVLNSWLNRLVIERLEQKSDDVLHFLKYFGNDWEQTFFYLLARNFGFKTNASSFALLAQRTPFKLLARSKDNLTSLEALLFGQAGLLNQKHTDIYPRALLSEYQYLRKKHQLEPIDEKNWKFARLRPVNFPTLRIAQFAMLMHQSGHLFRNIMETQKPQNIHLQLKVKASPYWDDHYVFDKVAAKKTKQLGKEAINNIIINTVAPVIFIYGKQSMRPDLCDKALDLLTHTPAENNVIIRNWGKARIKAKNAADTQALIQLKKYYCSPKKCLQCPIGHILLKED